MNDRSAAGADATYTPRRTAALATALARAGADSAKNVCTFSGSGSDSSATTRRPAAAHRTCMSPATEAVQVADGLAPALGLGPRRAAVVLQRHLHHHGAADAGGLAQQRQRVGHVLQHVGEHAQVVGVVGAPGRCSPSNRSTTPGPEPVAGELDRPLGDLVAVAASPPPRARAISSSSTPSPQPTSATEPGSAGSAAASRATWSAFPSAHSARQRAERSASSPSALYCSS